MSGVLHALTMTSTGASDSLLASNVLLLKTIGTNNATNASFVDSSSNNFTVTRAGDVTQGAFSPYVPTGYWSNYFDGSGDWLSMTNNDQTSFGTGDFTIECWFNTSTGGRVAGGGGTICGKYAGSVGGDWGFELGVSTARDISFYNGNSLVFTSPTNSFAAGVWNHLALVRQSGTMTAYVNGTSVHSATVTANLSSTAASAFWIGYGGGGSAIFNGSLSNLRIVKGSAVYTSNFTPPTTPLTAISGTSLLTCQDNRFIDRSSNNFTLTRTGDVSVRRFAPFGLSWDGSLGGSAYFDGNGDYLALPSSSGQLGTGNFTVEMWAFPVTKTGSFPCLFSNYNNFSTGSFSIFADHNSSAGWTLAVNGTFPLINGGAVIYNQWTHLAVTRVGSTMTLYVNGVASGTATMSATLNGNGTSTYIGTAGEIIPQSFNGFISDVRIVGSAVYTSNFTPPTTPLTAVSGTSLLLNFNNAAVYDATRASNLSLVGDTKTSTGQVKYATTSSLFDGAGDYATILPRPELAVGTGDFTWEAWVRPQTTSSQIWFASPGNGDRSGFAIGMRGGTMWWLIGDGSVWVFERDVGTALSTNNWHHVAVCRSSGTARLFVNGSLIDSIANTTNIGQGTRWDIGGYTASYLLTGNMEDLRISRTARYTAAFTPPTRALPVTAG